MFERFATAVAQFKNQHWVLNGVHGFCVIDSQV
jgi:hypothetical protein